MTKAYNIILSDGREIKGGEEKRLIENAAGDDICRTISEEYIKCANPNDSDYKHIPDRDCDGELGLDNLICPECGREVTEPDSKERFEHEIVKIDRSGLRDWVREQLKDELDTNVTTVSRTYCGIENSWVLDIEDPPSKIFFLYENWGSQYLQWCKVYDHNPAILLLENAQQLENNLRRLRIPMLKIEDVYPELSEGIRVINNAEMGPLKHRSIKGESAFELGTNESILEQMNYDDFERCVHCLLIGTLGNSQLLGSEESGEGVPDGTLNLHFQRDDHLYMWDAKYVKYITGEENETSLSGEYDKIMRHLKDLMKNGHVQRTYGGVQGIILFTPGIKGHNIVRLAEFIQEENLFEDTSWGGSVVYFPFETLLSLYESYRDNRSGVKWKEETFRETLHAYLSLLKHHSDDPDTIRSSGQNCIHMGQNDLSDLFTKIECIGREEAVFDVKEHMIRTELFRP